ncbi:MAG: MgtC/SapB family protein [Parvularculaceae bacterium]|nr:MgtC/SapB family protein [Parvularculaceae bacterium]
MSRALSALGGMGDTAGGMMGTNLDDLLSALLAAGVAIAAGFLIGFEREWTQALEKRRHAFAGARTFTLVSFSGALCALVSEGALLVAAGFIAIGGLAGYAYAIEVRDSDSRGGTTEIALLAAFLLGAAAGDGQTLLASAGAVAVALTLSLKDEVRHLARALNETEIHATIRFLAISVLILPIAPNRGFGPYDALNPRELWLMVVFISGLSFLGYWLVKAFGARQGTMAAGLVGGLASSTATTLSLARGVRDHGAPPRAAAAGIVMANLVMTVKIAGVAGALAPPLLPVLARPLGAAGAVGVVAALLLWRRSGDSASAALSITNPFELRPALMFAGLIAVISVLSAFVGDRIGETAVFLLAFVSGLADVDAVVLPVSRQAGAGALSAGSASIAILIAAGANILAKGAMAMVVGGRPVGFPVALSFAAMIAAAASAFLLWR